MRSVSVSDAKNNLSALLREIRGGATILITDRGVPVARLVAPATHRGIPPAVVEMAHQGRLMLPQRQPGTKWLDLPRPRAKGKASALAALLDERERGR
jgi:prevent-host-death family protein